MSIDEVLLFREGTGRAESSAGGQWLRIVVRAARTRRGMVGLAILVPVVLFAGIGPFLAPHSPSAFVAAPFAPPGRGTPLGTDFLGRDVVSRLMAGGWRLLMMACAATGIGVGFGTLVGLYAAYSSNWLDGLLMRGADVVLAFPQLVFALLLVSVLGPRIWLIILAVGLSHVPQVARVVRAATLDLCERDFVKVAQLNRTPRRTIIWTEILPNLSGPLMVEVGLRLTFSIILMAGLSFLGLGVQAPTPDWGVMINENRIGLASNPWAVVAPAALIALLTVGMNTFTDAVARVASGIQRDRRGARVRRLRTVGAALERP
jgi:peptide/nickel transport system permease protein